MTTIKIEERPLNIYKSKFKNIKLDYPQPRNDKAREELPKLFSNFLIVGGTGSGKTHSTTAILKEYQDNDMITKDGTKHEIRIIWISPTGSSSSNQAILKNINIYPEDMYDVYSDDLLEKIMMDIEKINEDVKKYKIYKEVYKLVDKTPERKIPDLLKKFPEIDDILKEFDYKHPDEIDMRYKERPATMIVLDDLLGSDAFNKKSTSKLLYYLIKNRHYWSQFFILTQAIKGCTKSIRQNCKYFLLSKCASKKYILSDMYDEVSNVIDEETFEKIYDLCCEEKYGSLVIDFTGSDKKFYKGLEKELIIIK
jgi:Cdc6-like AAA superfamily ATPase